MSGIDFPQATVGDWIPFLMAAAHPARPMIASKRLVSLMEEIGYEAGATRVALSRLRADGLVERERSGRETSYRIDEQQLERLVYVRRRVDAFGHDDGWDGTWTIVLASLPDDLRVKRYHLKTRLAVLGFGRVRDTVWCAPRDRTGDLEDVVAELDLGELVHVFAGRPAPFMDIDGLVHEWWDVDSLSDRYRAFTERFEPVRTARAQRELSDSDALRWWLRATHDYQALVFRDPELPHQLLPPGARRLRTGAVRLHATLEARLGGRARSYVLRRLGVAEQDQSQVADRAAG